jgi:hypothetical protein
MTVTTALAAAVAVAAAADDTADAVCVMPLQKNA